MRPPLPGQSRMGRSALWTFCGEREADRWRRHHGVDDRWSTGFSVVAGFHQPGGWVIHPHTSRYRRSGVRLELPHRSTDRLTRGSLQQEQEERVQFYTASARKANRLSIALANLTGHPPSLFRFTGGGWAVQETSVSAAAGHAICHLLKRGVGCDRITAPMVLAELQEARSSARRNTLQSQSSGKRITKQPVDPAGEQPVEWGGRCADDGRAGLSVLVAQAGWPGDGGPSAMAERNPGERNRWLDGCEEGCSVR